MLIKKMMITVVMVVKTMKIPNSKNNIANTAVNNNKYIMI